MQKRWVVKPGADQALVKSLAKQLNINPILTSLLIQRGISTFEQARHFFRPLLEHLHDPFLMKDMDKAIDRIEKAIASQERILIYGDYDVDGTTAVSLVYMFLKERYSHLDFYIPDRYKEGYGVSTIGITWAHENGYSLIIALDCGIKAIDKVQYANSLGIDFIICDHHRPGSELPPAYAVLDPKRNDCTYPFDELSGCGIGFKLVQAFAQKNNIPFKDIAGYLDLVAVSIAADIVPITGENRTLAYFGLKRLNEQPRAGIKAILEVSGVNKELTISDIVFTIAPRINAAGRIESGNQAVELLIADNATTARFQGDEINEKNTTRKTLDQNITEQAFAQIEKNEDFKNRKSTVVFHPDWHKGVIGIVASRLTDKYYRPTIVLTQSNGYVAGSARSVKDFDIYNAIEACSDLLDQFGGHMYAAGLTMRPENIPAFCEKFEQIVCETIDEKSLTREVEIDAELDLKDITPSFYKILRQFAPFGPGNMTPVFKTEMVRDTGYGRVVGNNHLKLNLVHKGSRINTYDGIAFQMGHYHPMIANGMPFNVCYHIEENTFNNKTSLQLNVKDISFES